MSKEPYCFRSLQKKFYLPVLIAGVIAIILTSIMPTIGEVGMASEKAQTVIGQWVAFFGEFHPLFLHLPIGALMLVFLMEAAGLASRGRYKPNTTLGLFFASVTGLFAVVFGYCLYLTGEFSGELVESHKRDGIIFTVLLIGSFLLRYTTDVKGSGGLWRPAYYMALGATGVMMMSAGHHGGEMTHGDPMDKAPWNKEEEDKPSQEELADPVVYTHIIHPILDAKCISCHGENKQKGGLRMDSFAALLDGGNDEVCLEPGDLKKSAMISFLHLPMEDDLHMPPEGKTQLTKEEIQILEWWVAMGAPEKAKRSEVEVTPEIAKALESLMTPEEIAAMEKAQEEARIKKEKELAATRERLAKGLEKVNHKYPGSLKYISQEGTDLSFSVVSYRKTFNDDNMEIINSVASEIAELDLGASMVTDKGLAKIDQFTKLKVLKLNETGITDAALPQLAKLKNLEVLNLYGTPVTDKGVKVLHGHTGLKKVYLWNTKVSEAAAKELEKSLREAFSKNPEGGIEPEVILGITGKE
ncbi:hypothetical protein Rhal01_03027 [Rubritalea halochordaticola]|uniref:Cytochrome C Planctomycete-type domain-containing protein n=1 Tax=Rubritalea halochordaticola TaxID=714537 RepID=A0ABP9V495_9BACT